MFKRLNRFSLPNSDITRKSSSFRAFLYNYTVSYTHHLLQLAYTLSIKYGNQ